MDQEQKNFAMRHYKREAAVTVIVTSLLVIGKVWGGSSSPLGQLTIAGIPFDFFLFGGMLTVIAFSNKLQIEPRDIAVSGLGLIAAYHLAMGQDMVKHVVHEGKELANLALLLTGFAIMAKLFEQARLSDKLPAFLPDDWKGGFVLLALVFLMSAILDNIASAMIGGVIANKVFKGKVQVGFLAAIVAASNGGGAFSVVGDTTTTMMWIGKVTSPIHVLSGIVGSVVSFTCYAIFASKAQDKYQRIQKDEDSGVEIKWPRAMSVLAALVGAVLGNIFIEMPGVGVFVGLLIGSFFVKEGFPWKEWKHVTKETVLIVSLVIAATLMPVKSLPPATYLSTFQLGCLSGVFDNIPLTALAIKQGGYDWPLLAFSVGFGGSMTWFGSSAGVALCSKFPEAKNLGQWIKQGWSVLAGYVLGFAALAGYLQLDQVLGDYILITNLLVLTAFAAMVYGIMQKPWKNQGDQTKNTPEKAQTEEVDTAANLNICCLSRQTLCVNYYL